MFTSLFWCDGSHFEFAIPHKYTCWSTLLQMILLGWTFKWNRNHQLTQYPSNLVYFAQRFVNAYEMRTKSKRKIKIPWIYRWKSFINKNHCTLCNFISFHFLSVHTLFAYHRMKWKTERTNKRINHQMKWNQIASYRSIKTNCTDS